MTRLDCLLLLAMLKFWIAEQCMGYSTDTQLAFLVSQLKLDS
jgi:hypothetical protein